MNHIINIFIQQYILILVALEKLLKYIAFSSLLQSYFRRYEHAKKINFAFPIIYLPQIMSFMASIQIYLMLSLLKSQYFGR